MSQHEAEVRAGQRFEFGANWQRFLGVLEESRIQQAQESLRAMLGLDSLAGRTFLDAGSGSGLFSLAARRLGASVHSFDYDPRSVACTAELRKRYFPADPCWQVESGSVLDAGYLGGLRKFDIVYSWGVLHHTGDMLTAMDNVAQRVAPGGRLFIALYNDQGWISRYWALVKRLYNRHRALRPVVVAAHIPYLLVARFAVRALGGKLREARGMSLWYDMIDWLGGWPFEVASVARVLDWAATRALVPIKVVDVGTRLGCNEFVFSRGS